MLSENEIQNLGKLLQQKELTNFNLGLSILEGIPKAHFPKVLLPDLLVIWLMDFRPEVYLPLTNILRLHVSERVLINMMETDRTSYTQHIRYEKSPHILRLYAQKYTESDSETFRFVCILYERNRIGLSYLIQHSKGEAQKQVAKQFIENRIYGNQLDLSNEWITHFPKVLCDFPQLEYLDLSNNPIHHIPKYIVRLRKLKVLKLKGCSLTHVHRYFKNLQTLVELDLSYNRFEKFPEPIILLKGLRHLNLLYLRRTYFYWQYPSAEDFLEIPAHFSKMKLTKLHIADNYGNSCFFNYPNVRAITAKTGFLDLDPFALARQYAPQNKGGEGFLLQYGSASEQKMLLDQMYNKEEQSFDFHKIRLRKLPDALVSYTIKKINLSGTGLFFWRSFKPKKLDEVLSPLLEIDTLEVLDLSKNRLQKLPPIIGKIKPLKRLLLDGNKTIDSLNVLLPLQKLEYLDIYGWIYLSSEAEAQAFLQNISLLQALPHLERLRYPRVSSYNNNVSGRVWYGDNKIVREKIQQLLPNCQLI